MPARIRTVKPSVFIHGLLFDLERATSLPIRLSYIGLWCWTDREARFEWKPRELKMGIIPYDADVDFALVLNVLANAGMIVKYEVDKRYYGWIPRFLDHQNINAREGASTLPPPPRSAIAHYEARRLKFDLGELSAAAVMHEPAAALSGVSVTHSNDLQEGSPVSDASGTRAPRAPLGRGTGRGMEEEQEQENSQEGEPVSGADSDASERVSDASALSDPSAGAENAPEGSSERLPSVLEQAGAAGEAVQLVPDTSRNVPSLPAVRGKRNALAIKERMAAVFAEIADGTRTRMKREQLQKLNAEMIFLYWTARFDHPKAILTPEREARIVKRLRENGDDVSEILYALDGASKTDQIMATGRYAGETKYDGIETVLRDRGQVEKFSNIMPKCKQGIPHAALSALEKSIKGDEETS